MRIRKNIRTIKPTLPALAVIGKAGLMVNIEVSNPEELKLVLQPVKDGADEVDLDNLYEAMQLHLPFVEHTYLPLTKAKDEPQYLQLVRDAVVAINPIGKTGTNRESLSNNEINFSRELFISLFPQASKIRDIELFIIPYHLDDADIIDIINRFLGEQYSSLTPQTNTIHISLLDAVVENLIYALDMDYKLLARKALEEQNKKLLRDKPIDPEVLRLERGELYIMATNPDIFSSEDLARLCSFAFNAGDLTLLSQDIIDKAFN